MGKSMRNSIDTISKKNKSSEFSTGRTDAWLWTVFLSYRECRDNKQFLSPKHLKNKLLLQSRIVEFKAEDRCTEENKNFLIFSIIFTDQFLYIKQVIGFNFHLIQTNKLFRSSLTSEHIPKARITGKVCITIWSRAALGRPSCNHVFCCTKPCSPAFRVTVSLWTPGKCGNSSVCQGKLLLACWWPPP